MTERPPDSADGRGRPRILAVATRFPWSSETFIERKVRALRHDGFDVTVAAPWIYPQDPSVDPVPVLQLPQVRSARTWGPSARALLHDRPARNLVSGALRDRSRALWVVPIAAGHYDIIHFEFSGIALTVTDLLPALAPARLVVSCRGHAEQIAPQQEPGRAERMRAMFARMDLIHCVSDDMARTVVGLGADPDKILVNRPAVDTARWKGVGRVDPDERGTDEKPLRVLSVGRLHWKKGFDDAIRAVARARQAGVTIDYRIAGEGPELEKLQYLRHSLGLEDSITLLGWQSQDEVESQLAWADVFLLPSLSEGISNSALEALAAGLPTISTRCGGMEEVLEGTDGGILVDVGDVDAWATMLGSLTDPTRRQALATGGTTRVREAFDLSRQARVFGAAYRKLVGSD